MIKFTHNHLYSVHNKKVQYIRLSLHVSIYLSIYLSISPGRWPRASFTHSVGHAKVFLGKKRKKKHSNQYHHHGPLLLSLRFTHGTNFLVHNKLIEGPKSEWNVQTTIPGRIFDQKLFLQILMQVNMFLLKKLFTIFELFSTWFPQQDE